MSGRKKARARKPSRPAVRLRKPAVSDYVSETVGRILNLLDWTVEWHGDAVHEKRDKTSNRVLERLTAHIRAMQRQVGVAPAATNPIHEVHFLIRDLGKMDEDIEGAGRGSS